MTRAITIAPGAEADIALIWDYGAAEFGAKAADAYVAELDAVLQRILEFPNLGPDCAAIRKGYRRIGVGSHLIYYIPHEQGISVIRVLHERMDARRHLRYEI